jgi:hypothetical protein
MFIIPTYDRLKLFYAHFTFFFYVSLHFHVFLTTVQSILKKCLVDVYPIDVNPIELYPKEANLIGKGVVEVTDCHQKSLHLSLLRETYRSILQYFR